MEGCRERWRRDRAEGTKCIKVCTDTWICVRQEGRERKPCRDPRCCSCQEQGHPHAPGAGVTTTSCQPQALSTPALLFHIWPRVTSETSPGSRDHFPHVGQVHPDPLVTSKCHRPLGRVGDLLPLHSVPREASGARRVPRDQQTDSVTCKMGSGSKGRADPTSACCA